MQKSTLFSGVAIVGITLFLVLSAQTASKPVSATLKNRSATIEAQVDAATR